jgi:hypothetical protein
VGEKASQADAQKHQRSKFGIDAQDDEHADERLHRLKGSWAVE